MKTVILLDLNHTLVENSQVKKSPFTRQIAQEEYRQWLVNTLKPYHVILMTARPEHHTFQTIRRIQEQTGWMPQEWYFNVDNNRPPQAKRKMLIDHVFPRHGIPNHDTIYIAIESNPATRKMYGSYNIESVWVKDGEIWSSLKDWTKQDLPEVGNLTTE